MKTLLLLGAHDQYNREASTRMLRAFLMMPSLICMVFGLNSGKTLLRRGSATASLRMSAEINKASPTSPWSRRRVPKKGANSKRVSNVSPAISLDGDARQLELSSEWKTLVKSPQKETNVPAPSSGDTDSKSSTMDVETVENELLWKLVVGGICFLWGTNFATIRQIFIEVPDLDPSVYASWRFGIAALVFLPSFIGRLTDLELLKNGFICGAFVFIGYIGQAIGLANGSTPEKSAFIAALCVVWVPILQSFLSKDWSKQKWGSTFLAITGIGFLELVGSSPPNVGDLWSLLQPLGFGSSYILIETSCKAMEKRRKEKLAVIESKELEALELKLAEGIPPSTNIHMNRDLPLTAAVSARNARETLQAKALERAKQTEDADAAASTGLQIFSIALLSTAYALCQGHGVQDFLAPLQSTTATVDLVYTGLITTALAIYAQTVVSTKVKSTDIAIILAGEPIFASLCAAFLLHETVSNSDIFGGLLVVISCIGSEVDLSKKKPQNIG